MHDIAPVQKLPPELLAYVIDLVTNGLPPIQRQHALCDLSLVAPRWKSAVKRAMLVHPIAYDAERLACLASTMASTNTYEVTVAAWFGRCLKRSIHATLVMDVVQHCRNLTVLALMRVNALEWGTLAQISSKSFSQRK